MKDERGTTLIELVLYIGLVGMILTTISMFLLNMLNARIKTSAISEITANGRLIQDRLFDSVRHAQTIDFDSSVFDVDPGVLTLNMTDPLVTPTIFSLISDDGQFQINEGGSGNIGLTSDSIHVTNLVFTNLTSEEDVGIIQVQFTLTAFNPSSDRAYDYEESFQTTLRIPLHE